MVLMANPTSNIATTDTVIALHEKAKTNNVAKRPPAKAAMGSMRLTGKKKSVSNSCPSTNTQAAPSAAPPDTPIKPGSASGFRNKPCITAPLTPNPAPTRADRSIRGKRISKTIVLAIPVCDPNRMLMSSPNPRDLDPIDNDNTDTHSSNRLKPTNMMACLLGYFISSNAAGLFNSEQQRFHRFFGLWTQ